MDVGRRMADRGPVVGMPYWTGIGGLSVLNMLIYGFVQFGHVPAAAPNDLASVGGRASPVGGPGSLAWIIV